MTEMTATGWELHAEACRKRLAQGDSAGAETSFSAALAEAEAIGPDSPALAACLTVLAQVRLQQRDTASAEQLFRRALEVRERAAEFDHTGVIQILGYLATLHSARSDFDEAEALLVRALTLADKFLQSSHPAVASLLNNLSRLYFKRADYAKADRMLVRLLQIKQALGTEHPEVAGVLASIAALRSALGKHDVAEQLWRRVLAIREKSLPSNDPALISTLNSLADACASQGEHEEALHFRERGVRLQAGALGSDRPQPVEAKTTSASEHAITPAEARAPIAEAPRSPTPASLPARPTRPSATLATPPEARVPVAARPTPPPVEIAPMLPAAAARAPTPATPAVVTPPNVRQSRITPIPVAPLVPPARNAIEPFDPTTSGDFAPVPPASAGVPGGPPTGLIGSLEGIGGPPPIPGARTPSSPNGVPQTFGGIAPPAPRPAPILAAPLAPVAAAPMPKPAPKERIQSPAPAPAQRRSEPSLERPRYQGYDDGTASVPRRGGVGRILVGLAVAAGIGFAAFTFVGGDDLSPVEAVADTVAAEPRMIRVPAESLKVARSDTRRSAPAAISLDSALAASRARNALDTGSTLGVSADSAARPIVVPGPRTLDALSRAVDAGLKSSLDSAFRAPSPTTLAPRAP